MTSKAKGWLAFVLCALAGFASAAEAPQSPAEEEEPGLLEGTVLSGASGSPVHEAVINAIGEGVARYAKTDLSGEFQIELPPGEYEIEVEHTQFETEKFTVTISPGVTQSSTFTLGGGGTQVEQVVVVGTYQPQGEERARWSDSVMDIIGREDFQISGDTDAATALSRVTGVTVVGDKYVYVRGLGERYSNTTFNDSIIPSPDPLRRVIPMDLFPAAALENIDVQKTYSVTQFGDFSGGSVTLRTRAIEDEPVARVKVEVGSNTESTDKKALQMKGGSRDWTGYDEGPIGSDFREMPADLKNANLQQQLQDPTQQTRIAQSLNQQWNTHEKPLDPSYSVDVGFGNLWNLSNGGSFGFLAGGKYRDVQSWIEETRQDAQTLTKANPSVQENGPSKNYTRTEEVIDLSGLLNMEWTINEANLLRSTTFLTRSTNNNAFRWFLADENKGSGEDAVNTTFEWEERELFTQQLSGEHFFLDYNELEFKWYGTYAKTKRDKPDTRAYVYERPSGSSADTPYILSDDQGALRREWEKLEDDFWSGGFDLSMPFSLAELVDVTARVGGDYYDKERKTDNKRFEYLTSTYEPRSEFEMIRRETIQEVMTDPNLGANKLELQLNSRNTNLVAENYDAEEELYAGYLELESELGTAWRIVTGVRYEDFNLTSTPVVDQSGIAPIEGKVDEQDWLPAVTATWSFTDDMQLRAAYSHTLNRPDMREVGPVRFVDPETRYAYIGNPSLKEAKIDNYDLRWEWYFAGADNLQIALFYKDFSDPIEIEVIPGAPVLRRPFNADSAENKGVELTLRKQLDFGEIPYLRDTYFKFNGAYIDSKVDQPSDVVLYSADDRELQGQSKYVVNAQLVYDNIDRDIQAALLYNWVDDRIIDVGTDDLPYSKEDPAARLDFNFRYGLDLWDRYFTLIFKARNLLNEETKVTRGEVTEREFKTGVTFVFGVNVDL